MKRFISLMLSLTMLFGIAAGLELNSYADTYSGTCGDEIVWELTNTSELVITGTGSMYDYNDAAKLPWYSKRYEIKKVSLSNGITSICKYAFYDCHDLFSVQIPDSVTSIGIRAFDFCVSLKSVFYYGTEKEWSDITVGFGNDYLQYKADIYYSDYDEPTFTYTILDDNTVEITGYSDNCESISIPSVIDGYTVTSIGMQAFVLCKSLTSVTLPDSVTNIGYGAFEACPNLSGIKLSDSLISIGERAFGECIALTDIVIPDSVTSIGDNAFEYCISLTDIVIPAAVESIGEMVFCCCTGLTSINVDKDNQNYSSADGLLLSKDKTELIQYPSGIKAADYIIPDYITSIGESAFAACSNLESVIIPDSVSNVGERAFEDCENLKSVTIGNGIKRIPYRAFYYCTALSAVTMSSSVEYIDRSAFETFGNITDVYYYGTENEWENLLEVSYNDNLKDAVIHYLGSVDKSALLAVLAQIEGYASNDYSLQSYNNLIALYDKYIPMLNIEASQKDIDNAVSDLLTVISLLEPYMELCVTAPNGAFTVTYNDAVSSNVNHSLLFATSVTLNAVPNDGYEFVGWYDIANNLYLSTSNEYTFRIIGNTYLKAVFIKENSVTLTFTTYSNWVQGSVTKTIDEWNEIESIDELIPDVPYRYGYSNGRWVYDNAEVLAKLKTGENVSLIPEYDEDDTSLPAPRESENGVPVLDLYYKLDADTDVGSFVMAAGIPDDCQIESIGVAFYYKKANEFDPTKFELLINNKMLVGRFNTDKIEDIYIVNMNKFSSAYNWAARGYVTYYDADGNLKTVYSNQVNIVNREQV